MTEQPIDIVDFEWADHFTPQKRSRPRQQPGDIFALQPNGEDFVFGRVAFISDKAEDTRPFPDVLLTYIFDIRAADPVVDVAELTPDRLLLPPLWVNRRPWTQGVVSVVGRAPLASGDTLNRHRFFMRPFRTYLDEYGEPSPQDSPWTGEFALNSEITFAYEIWLALQGFDAHVWSNLR